ncbi:hypothetical protein EVAR_56920_1 [Eumeta japonica]|uniref:Uncharacterized protein n=1 Tax=Eumeta variegata TaxID=151549 RepID=A0A4C1YDL6_EUMVA|nr:hypothetical protein EVAR_56920_1 [Eumeta japonica]
MYCRVAGLLPRADAPSALSNTTNIPAAGGRALSTILCRDEAWAPPPAPRTLKAVTRIPNWFLVHGCLEEIDKDRSSTFEIEVPANQDKVESWLESQQVAALPTTMSKPNEKPTRKTAV